MKKNTRVIFIFCLIILASIPLIYRNHMEQDAASTETYIDRMKTMISPSVVKIHCGEYMGSGMIIDITDTDVILVTNRHLVMNDVSCEVDFFGDVSAHGENFHYDDQNDIAFVKVSLQDIPDETKREIDKVDTDIIYDEEVTEDEQIIQIGSSDGVAANCYQGVVTATSQFDVAFYTDMLVTDCEVYTGMSGGGVFDSKGRLIGMITGGDMTQETRELGSNVTYSIPVDQILEAYKKVQ